MLDKQDIICLVQAYVGILLAMFMVFLSTSKNLSLINLNNEIYNLIFYPGVALFAGIYTFLLVYYLGVFNEKK